jgi:SAM-dependent methyltransferase
VSWEWQAESWLRWARTPGHDSYWYFRELFFDAIVPAPGHRTLEVGCGEGRVARDLARLGHTVVALDASPTLVSSAAADPAGRYLAADAGKFQSKDPDAPFVIDGSYSAATASRTPSSATASRSPSAAGATASRSTPAPWRTPAS